MKNKNIRFEIDDISYKLKQSKRLIDNFIGNNYTLSDDDDLQGFILDLAGKCIEDCHKRLDEITKDLMN